MTTYGVQGLQKYNQSWRATGSRSEALSRKLTAPAVDTRCAGKSLLVQRSSKERLQCTIGMRQAVPSAESGCATLLQSG